MPSPERTFGPIGWQRFLGEGESASEEATADDGASDRDREAAGDEVTDRETDSHDDEVTYADRLTSERTLGPMNWRIPFGGDANPDPDPERSTGFDRAPGFEESTGFVYPHAHEPPPSYERPRQNVTDGEVATRNERLTGRIWRSFSLTAVLVGVGLILLIDTMSLMVPLLAAIGGGLIGGFVAGYVAGGVIRGTVHALLAGVVGGTGVGFLTAAIGVTLGLFMEPATLFGTQTGLVVPTLSGWGLPEPLLVTAVFAAMITIDATIGGVVGGTLRSLIDRLR